MDLKRTRLDLRRGANGSDRARLTRTDGCEHWACCWRRRGMMRRRPRPDCTVIGKVVGSDTGEAICRTRRWRSPFTPRPRTPPAPGRGRVDDGGRDLRIPAAPGRYRLTATYVSYKAKKSSLIEVKAGAPPVTVDLAMTPEGITEKEIMVTARTIKDTESAILASQKNAAAVSDAISAEQISKSTDSNAAEAMERVTGVSVVDGKYVFVRGMGERYSATQVNGSSVGTPEPNKRVVPLDLFPTGSLDNVVVQKTYTPDMEGEFGGGVVSVNTKTIPAKRMMTQSLSLGMMPGGSTGAFMTYDGGRWDAFGFDDGTRQLPETIGRVAGTRLVTGGRGGLTNEQLAEIGSAFSKLWTPRSQNLGPSISYSGVLADSIDTVRPGARLSLLGVAVQRLRGSNARGQRILPVDVGWGHAPGEAELHRRGGDGVRLGRLGRNLHLSARQRPHHALHALYTRQSDDKSAVTQGPNENYGVTNVRTTEFVLRRARHLLRVDLTSSYLPNCTVPTWISGSTTRAPIATSPTGASSPTRRRSGGPSRSGS